jgi:hypothetical protein
MSNENEHQPPVGDALRGVPSPLEQALAAFSPAPPQLDRDRLMFLAGAAAEVGSRKSEVGSRSVGGRYWFWPASTATLAATSLALAIALFARPAPQPLLVVHETTPPTVQPPRAAVERDVPPPRLAVAVPPRPAATTDSYLKTREVALRMGLDALGSPGSGGGQASGGTYLELLEGLTQSAPAAVAAPAVERSPNM